jgi:hypothetical protein
VDPVRNPYAPGAGQRPPELAGRDVQLRAFDVVLERVVKGRPERSLVLTGLRGVGKTVLLNALRSAAVRRRWGTGKLEARPEQGLRRPLSSALHQAVRELGHTDRDSVDHVLGVIRAFAQRESGAGARLKDQWNPGIDVPLVRGRADSGDIEIDLVELFTDVGGLAADVGKGIACSSTRCRTSGRSTCRHCVPRATRSASRVCRDRGRRRPAAPAGGAVRLEVLLRAALPLPAHRPVDRDAADRALTAPATDEDAAYTDEALAAMYAATGGYPYFIQAYGKAVWDRAPRSPITVDDVQVATPEAESELAVGFFGSRYERATPGEREYLRAMADVAAASVDPEIDAVATADVAAALAKKPQALSPARDALLKKGLIYSGERGRIAFTVPHFGRYLREHAG